MKGRKKFASERPQLKNNNKAAQPYDVHFAQPCSEIMKDRMT